MEQKPFIIDFSGVDVDMNVGTLVDNCVMHLNAMVNTKTSSGWRILQHLFKMRDR